MIDRYSRKELKNIWSEENKYKIWLDIEIAAADAMVKYKIFPKIKDFKKIEKKLNNVNDERLKNSLNDLIKAYNERNE